MNYIMKTIPHINATSNYPELETTIRLASYDHICIRTYKDKSNRIVSKVHTQSFRDSQYNKFWLTKKVTPAEIEELCKVLVEDQHTLMLDRVDEVIEDVRNFYKFAEELSI